MISPIPTILSLSSSLFRLFIKSELSVENLSDSELLELAEFQIPAEQQEILADLIYKNREGKLNEEEKKELAKLIKVYDVYLLKKSEALSVAVKRGLIAPLSR